MGNNLEQLEIHQGNVIEEFRRGGNVRRYYQVVYFWEFNFWFYVQDKIHARIIVHGILLTRRHWRRYFWDFQVPQLRYGLSSLLLGMIRLPARNGVNMPSAVSNPGMFYVTTEEWAACCAFDPHAAHVPRSQINGANNTTSSSIASDESYISE